MTDPTAQTNRQRRLALLARATLDTLEAAWSELGQQPDYTVLKGPETGLVLVRGRTGGTGARFNLGEMTVTRCVVGIGDRMGVGTIAGRDKRKAELVALLDAALQDPMLAERLESSLLTPEAARIEALRAARAAKVASTKVDFFTLVRGEG